MSSIRKNWSQGKLYEEPDSSQILTSQTIQSIHAKLQQMETILESFLSQAHQNMDGRTKRHEAIIQIVT